MIDWILPSSTNLEAEHQQRCDEVAIYTNGIKLRSERKEEYIEIIETAIKERKQLFEWIMRRGLH